MASFRFSQIKLVFPTCRVGGLWPTFLSFDVGFHGHSKEHDSTCDICKPADRLYSMHRLSPPDRLHGRDRKGIERNRAEMGRWRIPKRRVVFAAYHASSSRSYNQPWSLRRRCHWMQGLSCQQPRKLELRSQNPGRKKTQSVATQSRRLLCHFNGSSEN